MRIVLVMLLALATTAHAGEAEDVRAFFGDLVKRANAFDASVSDLYSSSARIIALRDGTDRLEMTGSQLKEMVIRVMPIAERCGDTNTFEDVEVFAHGAGFRVTATRTPAVKCVRDTKYHLDVIHLDGSWRVVEEYLESVSLSKCKPSRRLAKSLEKMRRGHLALRRPYSRVSVFRQWIQSDLDDDSAPQSKRAASPFNESPPTGDRHPR